MQNKTPEERKAIAAKGHATRRARIEAEEAARQDELKYAGGLREKIAALEKRLASLERMETMNAVSAAVTDKALLRADEIAGAALPWEKASGVYFLLDGDEVVYVGQAVNVYSRIGQHTDKRFDRYAFVPCAVDVLDRLESLYIHCLRPRLNGNQRNDAKCAPIALDALLGLVPIQRLR
ncbi:MAG: GIY-YIG nuclease family protein [Mizugakiibacter sp.]|uniref:GIY-YIG nuclease family protein n=1 Tax=Mizugakiibacter sp. TaxID=1972610 RepID=UPI003210CD30